MNTTNTLEVIQTFGNKIDSYIQIAAEKGNQTVEHFWPIIVRQQSIEAWVLIMGISLMILVCFVLLKRGIRDFINKETNDVSMSGVLGIFSGFCLVCCISALVFNFSDIVAKLLNPEYTALQEVIKMIK